MISNSTNIEVEVLLATYNGERYLAEQLDSLLAQTSVMTSLLVSDDGSSDLTLEILQSYRSAFTKFKILQGPRKGPQANFFYLLSRSEGDFVALCDQDDIWEPDHLKNSLARLKPGKPSVTFSSVNEFSTRGPESQRIWPKKLRIGKIENIIFENPARGCTIVMNKSFIKIVASNFPKNSIMHDWWIALVAKSLGCLTASSTPEVKYRIHANNAVGVSPPIKTKFKRLGNVIRDGSLITIDQIRDLYSIYSAHSATEVSNSLSVWTKPTSLKSLGKQVFSRCKYRNNFFEDVALRTTFIWVWLNDRIKE